MLMGNLICKAHYWIDDEICEKESTMKGRIIKEVTEPTNTRRRSGAKYVNIPVQDCLTITDDGVGFEIAEFINLSEIEDNPSQPHRHPYFQILYVERADGRHIVDHALYENMKDEVYLICPGQVHCWEDVTDAIGMRIYFNEDFLIDSTLSVNAIWELNLLREMGGAAIKLTDIERTQIDQIINMMFREHKHKSQEYASVVRSFLNVLLIQLYRIFQRESEGTWPLQRRTSLVENFQKLVGQHVAERRSVKFYADRLDVSMGYLNEQVKRQMGMTPGEYVKKTAVTEAKRLIANTNLSMAEIAQSLGFTDGSYFCRLFKTEMGMTPMKFKQSCITKSNGRLRIRRSFTPKLAESK
jgi:AraC-like DNA-binding protein